MLEVNEKILCAHCFADAVAAQTDHCPVCGHTYREMPENTGLLPLGTILHGQYSVGRTLGQGAFGVTYLSYDMKKNVRVAIKEYYPLNLSTRLPGTLSVVSHAGKEETIYTSGKTDFFKEAETIARFKGNVGIVGILDFFYENNTAYNVMEYVDGMDLKRYVETRGGSLPYCEAYELFMPLLYALRVVHAHGVVHRDISPDNIYIAGDGAVKLLDFGSARDLIGERTHTIMFKEGFSPLEQYTRKQVGKWSDIYALGAVMYYMLTGMRPISATERFPDDALQMPSAYGCKVPADFEALLQKMLAVQVQDRFLSTGDVLTKLTASSSESPAPRAARPAGKKLLIPALALAAVAMLGAGAWIWLSRTVHAESRPYTMTIEGYSVPGLYTGDWARGKPNGEGKFLVTGEDTPIAKHGDTIHGPFRLGSVMASVSIAHYDDQDGQEIIEIGVKLDPEPTVTPTPAPTAEPTVAPTTTPTAAPTATPTAAPTAEPPAAPAAMRAIDVYDGGTLDGVPHGIGKKMYADDTQYIGEWVHGTRAGYGVQIHPDGTRHAGMWQDQPDGYFAHLWNDGLWIGQSKGYELDGLGIMLYNAGHRYLGEWREGCASGFGVLFHPDGTADVGLYENNEYKGKPFAEEDADTLTYPNGDVYRGEMKDGLRDGYGLLTCADGRLMEGYFADDVFVMGYFHESMDYVGFFEGGTFHGMAAAAFFRDEGRLHQIQVVEYVNGHRNSEGVSYFPTTKQAHIGHYRDDKRSGKGIYTWPDGKTYIGEFAESLIAGEGHCYQADGSVQIGTFLNNVYVDAE